MENDLTWHAMCLIRETKNRTDFGNPKKIIYIVSHEFSHESLYAVGKEEAIRVAELLNFKYGVLLFIRNNEFTPEEKETK